MKKFRPLTFILILALIFGIMPRASLAAEDTTEPGEHQGFVKEVEQKTEVPEGYIGIYTAEDMNSIRNDLSGKYILMADIDLLSLGFWEPIGKCQTGAENPDYNSSNPGDAPFYTDDRIPFTGEIDGNGHTIENMNISVDNIADTFVSVGLIASAENATVKNLGIKSVTLAGNVKGAFCYGGIFGEYCCCKIENCFSEADITINTMISENTEIYGLAAREFCPHGMSLGDRYKKLISVIDCANYGDFSVFEKDSIDYSSLYLSGIGGYNNDNCINTGDMKFEMRGNHKIGTNVSLNGITAGAVPVKNCTNYGAISVVIEDARFENEKPIKAHSNIECSGIVSGGGALAEYNMPTENCINYGDISVKLKNVYSVARNITTRIGGIAARASFASVKKLGNEGKISFEVDNLTTAPSEETNDNGKIYALYLGGIYATHEGNGDEYLASCYNSGAINVNVTNVTENSVILAGGICSLFTGLNVDGKAAQAENNMHFANSYNTGDITVNSDAECYVGGMMGYFRVPLSKSPITSVENCYNAGKINVTGKDKNVGAIAGIAIAGETEEKDAIKMQNLYYSNADLPCVGSETGKIEHKNNKLLTDSDMKKRESFVGFNFVKVWGIDESRNDGLPYLRAFYGEIGEAQKGDLNMDGTVNTADAVLILKCSADMLTLDKDQKAVADVNADGEINTADAVQILKFAAGIAS